MDPTLVIVAGTVVTALITGVFSVAVARIAANVRHVKDTVGTKNGNGDLATMQARILAWCAEHARDDQVAFEALRNQIALLSEQAAQADRVAVRAATVALAVAAGGQSHLIGDGAVPVRDDQAAAP